MKRFYPSNTLAMICLLGTVSVVVTGCAGNEQFPDASAPVGEVHPGAIHGSVFGGHAPVSGAHVYVLQGGTGGYASASTSEISANYYGTDSSSRHYVLTDNNGQFTITNDYTCTTGHLVYLAATGGTPALNANSAITGSSVTGGPITYTITFTAANTLAAGQTVSFAGLNETFEFSSLNNTTQLVSGATATTFTINYTPGGPVSGTGSATAGTATANANPAIANIAVLGTCPGVSGEFATTLSYVYMNEVSTTAAAYALAGFGTGPFTIGSPNTVMALTGIANATINAKQLYDIQGSNSNATAIGEGHVARPFTPAGNGIVPQDTLDTIGNILASCVDSNTTAFALSINCGQLFNFATNNGVPASALGLGTVAPSDTATAAFNIAHNPAGAPAYTGVYTTQLFALQGSQAMPFNPSLTTAPNDFTVGIQYTAALNPGTGSNPGYLKGAESVVVDGSGDFWFTSQPTSTLTSSYFGEFSPAGTLLHTPVYNTSFTFGNIAIDSNGNAWSGSLNQMQLSTTKIDGVTGMSTSFGTGFTEAAGPVADNSTTSGNLYFVHGPTTIPQNNQTLTILSQSGGTSDVGLLSSSFAPGIFVTHGAGDSSGNLWFTSDTLATAGTITVVPKTSVTPRLGFPITTSTAGTLLCPVVGVVNPEQVAIDNAGNGWIPLYGASGAGTKIMEITPSQTLGNTCYYWNTGHGPYGAAVDGSNNVWITNRTDGTLTELSAATGFPISPPANYKPVNQVGSTTTAELSDPMNVTVDISGDVIVSNNAGNSIVELIGAGTPTYAPLGVAAAVGKLGGKP
jgi:hypothetical protein